MLLGMPFVPLQDLFEVFLKVGREINPDVLPVWEMMDKTYVQGRQAFGRRSALPPRFPSQLWCVYEAVQNRNHRTNNYVESFHNKFNLMVRTHHGSIWKVLEYFQKDQRDNQIIMTQLAGGHTRVKHPAKKEDLRNQEQVLRLVSKYNEYKEEGNEFNYLKAISYRLKRPTVDENEENETDDDDDNNSN